MLLTIDCLYCNIVWYGIIFFLPLLIQHIPGLPVSYFLETVSNINFLFFKGNVKLSFEISYLFSWLNFSCDKVLPVWRLALNLPTWIVVKVIYSVIISYTFSAKWDLKLCSSNCNSTSHPCLTQGLYMYMDYWLFLLRHLPCRKWCHPRYMSYCTCHAFVWRIIWLNTLTLSVCNFVGSLQDFNDFHVETDVCVCRQFSQSLLQSHIIR